MADCLLNLIIRLFSPDAQASIINVWSGIYGHFRLCSVMFSLV